MVGYRFSHQQIAPHPQATWSVSSRGTTVADSPMMTAGEFAHRAGVTVRTIQYYDQKGLLSPTKKGPANQRLYSEADMQRLDRILTLKYLGFSLNSILKLGDDLGTSEEVAAAVHESREQLDDDLMKLFSRMATLKNLSDCLAAKAAKGPNGEDSGCDRHGTGAVDWRVLAETIENGQQHDAWRRLLEDDATGPGSISREEVLAWHALMGDTIEAMEAGSPVDSPEVQALAKRFRRLGGMRRAREGLGNMMRGMPGAQPATSQGHPGAMTAAMGGNPGAMSAAHSHAGAAPSGSAPASAHAHAEAALPDEPKRGRDFYQALQRRTLGFLQRALDASEGAEASQGDAPTAE
jgi:DNA-binding transcriptional MerR regulator